MGGRQSRASLTIAALLAIWVVTAHAQEDVHLWLVQITDTHFGNAGSAERARRVVDEINASPMSIACPESNR